MKRWTAGLAAVTLLTASSPAMVAWAGNPSEHRANATDSVGEDGGPGAEHAGIPAGADLVAE